MSTLDPSQLVLSRTIGRVAVITLNRPDARNAVNDELATAFGHAVATAGQREDVTAIVVTGAGRAFCAGADLKAVRDEALVSTDRPEWGFAGFVDQAVATPVIAAVNGAALGGGAEIALACDLIVMADDAVLGFPEVKRGLIAGAGGAIRLPRQVPFKIANEVILTGSPMDAPTARQWGLVNRVVPRGEVVSTAVGLATVIAGNAPLSVRASKMVMRQASGEGADWDRQTWAHQTELIESLLASDDVVEGTLAFAERRPATWSGR